MSESELKRRLQNATGIKDDIVPESDLLDIILNSLDEYNRRRPSYRMTVAAAGITTVTDQPNYDIPSDALWVVEVCWNPFDQIDDDTTGTLEAFLEQTYLASLRSDHPSEVVAFRQSMAKWSELFRGHWRILNQSGTDQIWLDPPPTSNGDHVAVCYAKANTLSDLDMTKDQLFFRLCKAALKERWGMELAKIAGRAGAYSFPPEVVRLIIKEAKAEHDLVLSLITRSYYLSRGTGGSFVRGN